MLAKALVSDWLLIACLGIQFVAVWILMAQGWDRALPPGLFPLTGRWLRGLAWGGLVLGAGLLLCLALYDPPDPDIGSGDDVPAMLVTIVWVFVEAIWLAVCAGLVAAGYGCLASARRLTRGLE